MLLQTLAMLMMLPRPASSILGSTEDQVRELFNAVGIDGREAILDALPLWKQMRQAIDGTSDTIAGFLRDLKQFTGGLKFGDLSPLSAADQLAAAQSLHACFLEQAHRGRVARRAHDVGQAAAVGRHSDAHRSFVRRCHACGADRIERPDEACSGEQFR